MQRFKSFILLVAITILGAGCSSVAPLYSASLDNVQKLKDNGTYSAKVGTFSSEENPANVNPLKVRANSMSSPYQNSYSNYLGEAIKQELSLAKKLDPASPVEISGTLLKNDLNVAGFSTASADIQARFIVKNQGVIRYDQIKSAHHEWESSFAGNIAIPKAAEEYPIAIQKLLQNLYEDHAFMDSLK